MKQERAIAKTLCLLQLASPGLPVGGYSYSEGLETLVESKKIDGEESFNNWLKDSLKFGSIQLETALTIRGYQAAISTDLAALIYWNNWATATRETEELRRQSWQMGRALIRLFLEIEELSSGVLMGFLREKVEEDSNFCNLAIAFGIAAATWEIDPEDMALGYLHSWATNLINAAVKLIPLGQTQGQKLLFSLQTPIAETATEVFKLEDDDLASCSWGLSLASMNHEIQYARLFRS